MISILLKHWILNNSKLSSWILIILTELKESYAFKGKNNNRNNNINDNRPLTGATQRSVSSRVTQSCGLPYLKGLKETVRSNTSFLVNLLLTLHCAISTRIKLYLNYILKIASIIILIIIPREIVWWMVLGVLEHEMVWQLCYFLKF